MFKKIQIFDSLFKNVFQDLLPILTLLMYWTWIFALCVYISRSNIDKENLPEYENMSELFMFFMTSFRGVMGNIYVPRYELWNNQMEHAL